MAVNITGSIILSGTTNWEAGTTYGGNPLFALAQGSDAGAPLGPVPFPPPTGTLFSECTANFSSGECKMLVNPNKSGHTINNVPIVTINAMFMQKGTSSPCQPIMGIGTTSLLAGGFPVMTTQDKMSSVGFMNGLGIQQ